MSSPKTRNSWDGPNPIPQSAPGAHAAVGHVVENSIPLSIFPIATDKFCICFCGLPGRGKTHISNRLARYLSFFHAVPVQVYNAGEYRRNLYGPMQDAEWFDNNNSDGVKMRDKCNEEALKDMAVFLAQNKNGVVIMDAVNGTYKRRETVLNRMHASGAKVIFIEVQNTNARDVFENVTQVARTSPDYVGWQQEAAVVDYRARTAKFHYKYQSIGAYAGHLPSEPLPGVPTSGQSAGSGPFVLPANTILESPLLPIPPVSRGAGPALELPDPSPVGIAIAEERLSYLICDHSREHFVVHNVRGYLPLKIIHFVMNMRTTTHAFYLSRHGQSLYNAAGRIGGDSGLSYHGVQYAQKLANFVEEKITRNPEGHVVPARLWTSTMTRTRATTQFIQQNTIMIRDDKQPSIVHQWFQMKRREWHHLDELFAGSCDGMTYEEIEENFPEEFRRRKVDKLAYRYPRGESYLDVIARLEPIIIEMERHKEPLLIVGHQGILRVIYAFYMGKSRSETPYVSIPLNTVVELTPRTFDCSEERHLLYTPTRPLAYDGQDEQMYNTNPESH